MYNSDDIANRIRVLVKSKGISVKSMLSDLDMGVNTLQHMKTSTPKSDTLARIADYLRTSVDYLLGRTDNPDDCSVELREIQTIMNALSVRDKTELMSIIYKFYDEKLSR